MFRSKLLREQSLGDAQIQLAPLIDMMFILLIFFLVTTSFINLAGVRVERPASKTAQGLSGESIYVTVDQKGEIFLDGSPVSLLSLRGRVRAKLKGKTLPVVVVPDVHTEAQILIDVLDECKLAGASYVSIAAEKKRPTERPKG